MSGEKCENIEDYLENSFKLHKTLSHRFFFLFENTALKYFLLQLIA